MRDVVVETGQRKSYGETESDVHGPLGTGGPNSFSTFLNREILGSGELRGTPHLGGLWFR